MQTIYHIGPTNLYDGLSQEIADDAGCPPSWTLSVPPVVPEGKYAYFLGPDWIVIDQQPDPAPPTETPATNAAPTVV